MIQARARSSAAQRQRLPAQLAKQRILEAAEKKLIEGGPDAVRVQPIAKELGVTDAAIYHHFGSRDGLLEALVRFGGRRLRTSIEEAVSRWDPDTFDLSALIDLMLEALECCGHAWLLLWLTVSGWRDPGSGMFASLAASFHELRTALAQSQGRPVPDEDDARFLAALLAMVLVAEPLIGDAARRSVSLEESARNRRRFRAWLGTTFEALVRRDAPATPGERGA